MKDIELARKVFEGEGLSLVIVRDGRVIHRDKKERLLPLFRALKELGEQAKKSSLADKVIGRAAAMLIVCAGVKEIYTPVISSGACAILEEAGILWTAEKVVPQILNNKGDRQCPMEEMVAKIDRPEEGMARLAEFFRQKGLL